MSGIWSSNIGISLFGESHGNAIGITIDGILPGIKIDYEFIKSELNRRKPGKDEFSTKRKEDDEFEILSGIFNDITTGTPLTAIIRNNSQKSKDYEKTKNLLRPSHADYTGAIKYKGFNDYRGGGHFSGRITAPIVFLGALIKQILMEKYNIKIYSFITQIGSIKDVEREILSQDVFSKISDINFPVLDDDIMSKMKNEIMTISKKGDSVGGKIRCVAFNIPVGLGGPYFNSVEGKISNLAFAIPAVKGIEFGKGFDFAGLYGSIANDEYYMKDVIKTKTNNNGGVLGGITNGMPIDFSVVIKPTPSIFLEQNTVDMKSMKETKIKIEGRHDPCIVQRAVVVIEYIMAISILDILGDV